MNLIFRRLGVSELLPRYIFAENLFVRRRVLEVGAVAATAGASAQFLVERGARVVVACDDDLAAVEEAQGRLGSATLRFRASVFDDFPPGGFDLVLVADLAPFVRAPENLRQLAAQVAPTGTLLGGLRNPAGLALAQLMEPDAEDAPPTYGQVLDVLSVHFRSVEVATQSPLLGYQLAFERGEGLQVDGSLAGPAEAAYFVVLASQERLRPVDPTWVQLPPAPLAFTGTRLEEVATRAREWEERSRRLKDSLATARIETAQLHADLDVARGALDRAQEEAHVWRARGEAQDAHALHPLEQDGLAARVRRVESEGQVLRGRAEEAERRLVAQAGELEAARGEQKAGLAEVLAAQESVRLERARRDELGRLLDDARGKLTAAYEELRTAREDLTRERADRGEAASRGRGEALRQQLEEKLGEARARELRLADRHSTALSAVESLQAELSAARGRGDSLEERVRQLEADRALAERAAEADAERLRALQASLEVSDGSPEDAAARDTERAAAEADARRLADRARVLEAQERQLRAVVVRLETDLAEARTLARPAGEAELDQARSRIEALTSELDEARRVGAAQLQELEARRPLAEAAETSAAERARALERVGELQGELETLGGRFQQLVLERAREAEGRAGSIAVLRQRIAELEGQGAEERSRLAAALAEAEAALLGHAAEADARTAGMDAMRAERDRSAAEAAERLSEKEALAEALAQLQASAQTRQSELDEARARLAEREQDQGKEDLAKALEQVRVVRQLREQIQRELEQERARSRSALEAHAVADEALRSAVEAHARDEEALRAALDAARAAESDRAALEQARDEATAREGAVAERVEAAERRAEEAERRAAEAEERGHALESLGTTAAEERAQAAERIATVERQLEALAREGTEALAAQEALREAATAAEATHARALAEAVASAEERVAAAERATELELPELRTQLERETAERRRSEQAQARSEELVRRAESERTALIDFSDRAGRDMETVRAALDQARAELTEARDSGGDLQGRLELLQRRLAAQESELNALRRAAGRPATHEVQQIYERAQAEISAAKRAAAAAARPPPPLDEPAEKKR